LKQITVTIDSASVSNMNGSSIKLIAWKAVGNSDSATKPLVWSALPAISPAMCVSYGTGTSVYTSAAVGLQQGSVIQPSYQTPIATGQVLVLSSNSGGGGDLIYGGPPTAISVRNSTGVEYLCGLMQSQGSNVSAPYCGVPIFGGGAQQSLYPVDKILLGFSSAVLAPGEYIASLDGSIAPDAISMAVVITKMLLVDLTSADARSVSYSVNSGWSWGGFVWATEYSASAELATILIQGDG
jgi:hypothetical protein